ncbi:hypothetical protein BU107_04715 [Staphylococcus xylosus]|uniref:hypothetical protein n=1 Tax=Staphylococcus xylosus TaxID=1288 RepID=UPI000E680B35|nr:hypothetical protein [Staphylococcus xylosus]RIM88908.1 hypothetical protein BU107_04715 [Staphylococcus xylosus]
MLPIKKLSKDMAEYYMEEKLAQRLIESDHEILEEIGNQVLDEEGYPDWVKISDTGFILHITSTYSFEEWAELAKAIFNIENIKQFVMTDMYEMFLEYIRLFDIKIIPKKSKEELEEYV